MVGITLTPEQIHAAPPEVRHWLEQQVAALFAQSPKEAPHAAPPHLAQCTPGEAEAVLEQIENVLPVVSVFFELGRETASTPLQGMRAFRLADILRHTRLESTSQVVDCLEVINDALRRVRGDPTATICAFDREGRCYVAEATMHAVLAVWRGIVASHALQTPAAEPVGASLPPRVVPVVQAE